MVGFLPTFDFMNRRHFFRSTSVLAAGSALAPFPAGSGEAAEVAGGKPRFQFSLKWGMIKEPGLSVIDKFKLMKELGYDGVEMDSQFAVPVKEVLAAQDATGIPVQGVVNANHWSIRLSDPTADIRAKALEELLAGLRYTHAVGGSTILLVPGAVRDAQNENQEQVWERSIAGIRQAIPLAAELGVRIGIENVWNRFCYTWGYGSGGSEAGRPDPLCG